MPSSPSATVGTLHHIPPLTAFEPKPASDNPANLLLWVGGLSDTYHNVQYPYTLAKRLPSDWSLAQVYLTSAAQGWGISSLGRDVAELAKIVDYFRPQRSGKIVIMGHSTGCQDGLHYLASKDEEGTRPKVDGVILQAPVSDREALMEVLPKENYDGANKLAQEWVSTGRGEDCIPRKFVAPLFDLGSPECAISARRWLSLASPDKKGEDDFFSSDLPDERLQETFGKVNVPFLILYGAEDEYVPDFVDRQALVDRWMKVLKANNAPVDSKSQELLGGASHNLNGNPESVVDELCKRVTGFLNAL